MKVSSNGEDLVYRSVPSVSVPWIKICDKCVATVVCFSARQGLDWLHAGSSVSQQPTHYELCQRNKESENYLVRRAPEGKWCAESECVVPQSLAMSRTFMLQRVGLNVCMFGDIRGQYCSGCGVKHHEPIASPALLFFVTSLFCITCSLDQTDMVYWCSYYRNLIGSTWFTAQTSSQPEKSKTKHCYPTL